MFDFHKDVTRYFEMQRQVTSNDIIPFIESSAFECNNKRILEIGCAEAGVLKAFIDHGNVGVGVELSAYRYQTAKELLSTEIEKGTFSITNKNIYEIADPQSEFNELFDVIVLKDVIEHIPDQEIFIPKLKDFLKTDGVIFFAYPPWYMPFGGHQQMCNNKFLRTLPWFHILPVSIYRWMLKLFGESEALIKELLEIKSTGINVERLYNILIKNKFHIVGEIFWFINPIYELKFGFRKSKVLHLFRSIPYIRNFYTTAHYIIFKV